MAEGYEPMTEVDDEGGASNKDTSRRRRFGRRKEDPTEIRSDTEWVDTLVAHEGAREEPLAGSPLAAGEEDPDDYEAPALPEYPESEPSGELPQEAAEVGEEVILREQQLYRPDKMSLENRVRASHRHRGERDAFYEKSWTRRQPESMEAIHNYIDNVIGTDLDPSRRRERLGRAGMPPRGRTSTEAVESVQVEGLDSDLMIAFTFPKEEFRGARVVYETEGGYVVEVTRAVGGDDTRRETQYYTVSRVGEVAHVLDKMRAREAERRAREQDTRPVAPGAAPEPEASEDAPPTPEEVGAAGSASEGEPITESQAPTAPSPAAEHSASEEEAAGGKGRSFGGLFKRGKDDEPQTEEPTPGTSEERDEKKKGLGGLFKRKKDGEDEPSQTGEGLTEEENQS